MNVRRVLPRDAIPSVDDPAFDRSYDGDPDDEVIVVDGDPPRAYPIRYLQFHEIVNDVIGGEPIAVTWCPLCGSAVVYDRRLDGRTLTFGVSGKLADDDLVMYDRETDSEWKQSTGGCFAGEYEGERLSIRAMRVTTWGAFRGDGVVLQPPGGTSEAASDTDDPEPIDYDERPYSDYFESDGFGLDAHRAGGQPRQWDRTDLDPKTVVLGVETAGEAVGFPRPRVDGAGGVVTHSVGGRRVVVFAGDDGIFAYEDPGYSFGDVAGGRVPADGTTWEVTTGESADGRALEQVPSRRLFAFAWQDDHGPEAFYSP